jgi:Zn-dependent protease/CBS domain-containing protein
MRISGIPIHVPWSGVLGIMLIAWLWSPQFTWAGAPDYVHWIIAAVFAVLLYLSVLVHELAHALAAKRLGYSVSRIVLWVLGGYTVYERPRAAAGREAAIAASGPVATIVIAVVSGLLGVSLGAIAPQPVILVLEALCFGNAVMAAYNLLPGLPLDGGAILKSLVWAVSRSEQRGTVVAAWSGRIVAVIIFALPFVLAWTGGSEPDIAVVAVAAVFAAILWMGASSALKSVRLESRADQLRAGSMARRALPVDRDLPLAEALRRMGEAGAGALVITDTEGRPVGVVQEAAVAAIPEVRRPWVPVSTAARTTSAQEALSSRLAGNDLVTAVAGGPGEHLVTEEQGRVLGVLSAAAVRRRLRR